MRVGWSPCGQRSAREIPLFFLQSGPGWGSLHIFLLPSPALIDAAAVFRLAFLGGIRRTPPWKGGARWALRGRSRFGVATVRWREMISTDTGEATQRRAIVAGRC